MTSNEVLRRCESLHLSVPTTCEVECNSQCSVSDIMPTLTKQASERRFSGAEAHDFGSLHRVAGAPEVGAEAVVFLG